MKGLDERVLIEVQTGAADGLGAGGKTGVWDASAREIEHWCGLLTRPSPAILNLPLPLVEDQ